MVPNPGLEGRWEETFGGHTDSKKNGPTSVGLDVTFHKFQHVYGIPEHGDHFALHSTKSRNPYRLYNVDVLEYELNSEMALYGAIPFMIAHNSQYTVGFFWFNPSETWIDVYPSETDPESTQTRWLSESGTFRAFFFFGPTHVQVLQQYSQLTGVAPIPPIWSLGISF